MSSVKREQLLALALKRRATRLEGYACLADFHSAAYECDHVSPWTRSADTVDASVMLIAQDWASADYLNGPIRPYLFQLGYDPGLATNKNLHGLLKRCFSIPFSATYATNAFPFIKLGAMNASIAPKDMVRCVSDFLIPQIEIVKPKIAVCLGLQTYNAVRRALNLRSITPLDAAIGQPLVFKETTICAAAHTGRLGTNQRGAHQVEEDWAAMRSLLVSHWQ